MVVKKKKKRLIDKRLVRIVSKRLCGFGLMLWLRLGYKERFENS